MVTKYIKYKGSVQPKTIQLASDQKLKELQNAGFRQGKDYEVVSKKIALEKNAKGGLVKKKAKTVKKVVKALKKASKTHAKQAKTLSKVIKRRVKVWVTKNYQNQ